MVNKIWSISPKSTVFSNFYGNYIKATLCVHVCVCVCVGVFGYRLRKQKTEFHLCDCPKGTFNGPAKFGATLLVKT